MTITTTLTSRKRWRVSNFWPWHTSVSYVPSKWVWSQITPHLWQSHDSVCWCCFFEALCSNWTGRVPCIKCSVLEPSDRPNCPCCSSFNEQSCQVRQPAKVHHSFRLLAEVDSCSTCILAGKNTGSWLAAARLIFICFVHLKSLSIQCWLFLYSGRSCRFEYKFIINLMKLLALNIVGRGTSPFWCSSAWSQRFSCSNQEGTKQPLLAATFDYNYHITETCTKSVKLRALGKLQKHAWQIKSIKTSTHVNFNILLHTPSKNTISPIAACGKSTPEASPQQKRSVPPMLREERRLLPCYSHSLWTLYGIWCLYCFFIHLCIYIL